MDGCWSPLCLYSRAFEVTTVLRNKMNQSKVGFGGSQVVPLSAHLAAQGRRETREHLSGITVKQLRYMRGGGLSRRHQQVTSLRRRRDPLPARTRRATPSRTLWSRACEEWAARAFSNAERATRRSRCHIRTRLTVWSCRRATRCRASALLLPRYQPANKAETGFAKIGNVPLASRWNRTRRMVIKWKTAPRGAAGENAPLTPTSAFQYQHKHAAAGSSGFIKVPAELHLQTPDLTAS